MVKMDTDANCDHNGDVVLVVAADGDKDLDENDIVR